jgi:hypothetical protein
MPTLIYTPQKITEVLGTPKALAYFNKKYKGNLELIDGRLYIFGTKINDLDTKNYNKIKEIAIRYNTYHIKKQAEIEKREKQKEVREKSCQDVLYLRKCGFTFEEIGAALGLSKQATYNRTLNRKLPRSLKKEAEGKKQAFLKQLISEL